MSRFTSVAATNLNHQGLYAPLQVCSCQYTTVGSYSFTVPSFCNPGIGLGFPGLYVCVVGGGGGGPTTNCVVGCVPQNGSDGSAGNFSCFGAIVSTGGSGGGRICTGGCVGCFFRSASCSLTEFSGGSGGANGTGNGDINCYRSTFLNFVSYCSGCCVIFADFTCVIFDGPTSFTVYSCSGISAGNGTGGYSGIGVANAAYNGCQGIVWGGSGGGGGTACKKYASTAALSGTVSICVGSGGAGAVSGNACMGNAQSGGSGCVSVCWYV